MKVKHSKRIKLIALLAAFVLCVTVFPVTGGRTEAEETTSLASTYSQPDYNGVFEVYSTYFNYAPFTVGGNTLYQTSMYGLYYVPIYMEYSADNGRTWKRSGYMQYDGYTTASSIRYKISGLKPNTQYRTRIYYGDSYGNRLSPYRYTTTIKTGKAKAPAVKSVSVKAVNVKYHRHRVSGHYYWTGYSYVWIGPYTERYYTYKIRVTVKLKKKPGAKGLYVNLGGVGSKYVKGNKKKYVATFTPYPNYRTKRPPKGLGKKTVKIASYQDKTKKWVGYSKFTTRKRKVR